MFADDTMTGSAGSSAGAALASAASPPVASSGVPSSPPVAASAPAAATAPATPSAGAGAGVSSAAVVQPVAEEHGLAGRVARAILGALGGKEDVSRDPETGAKVTKPRSTGSQVRHIIGNALAGAGAGAAQGQGPGGGMRGLAAGVETGVKRATDDSKQGDKDFEADQNARLRKAQTAHLVQQNSIDSWNFSRNQVKAQFEDQERENSMARLIASSPSNKDLGVAPDFGHVLQMHKEMPELPKMQANGMIQAVPHVNDKGVIEGVHYFLVQPDFDGQRLATDQTIFKYAPPDKNGKRGVDKETVKAGTMTNKEFRIYRMAMDKEFNDVYKAQLEEAGKNKREADKDKNKPEAGTWSLQEDKAGNPIEFNSKTGETRPAGNLQRSGTHAKQEADYNKRIAPLVASKKWADSYLASGKFTGSNDEALMERFFDVAKPSSGFRMSQPQIKMFQESRGWMGGMAAKARHAATGTWLSNEQRRQVVDTIDSITGNNLQVQHAPGGGANHPAAGGNKTGDGKDPFAEFGGQQIEPNL